MEPEPAAPQLDLRFALAGGRTLLAERHVAYPYNVTAPLRRPGPARVIVQSVSGGLYRGERLVQRIEAAAGAQVTVELPTASVVQTMAAGETATQTILLRAAAAATLTYLSRPLILFPDSALTQTTEIVADRTATVIAREGFLLHDPSGGAAPFRTLSLGLTVRDGQGRLLALDRARVEGGLIGQGLPGVTGGFRAFGAVWLLRQHDADARQRLAAAVFALLDGQADCYGAPSALRREAGLVVRLAARDGGALDQALQAVTALLSDRSGS